MTPVVPDLHERRLPWHLSEAAELADQLGTDPTIGLTEADAARRLAEVGPNALDETHRTRWPSLLLAQFTDFMIVILVAR